MSEKTEYDDRIETIATILFAIFAVIVRYSVDPLLFYVPVFTFAIYYYRNWIWKKYLEKMNAKYSTDK